MLSRKSYFNATLFRKNLSRFWPLWGGVSLVGSVFPLYMLLTILGNPYIEVNAEAMARSLYGVVTMLAPGFLLVYAALCGVLVWSYLNSSRSVGLYHSLPVNRTCLYLTGLASGLAMVLIPFAVVGLLFCLVCLGCGILPLVAVGQTVLAVPGVNSLAQLGPVLEQLQAQGLERIMTAFDMDYLTNPHVGEGQRNLVTLLEQRGIPYGTYLWDPRYKGLDDYIWGCLCGPK